MAAGLTVGAEAKRDGMVRDRGGGRSLAENIMGEGLNGRVGGGGGGESWRQWLGRWWGAVVRPGVRRRWGGGGRNPYPQLPTCMGDTGIDPSQGRRPRCCREIAADAARVDESEAGGKLVGS